jgi:hypothetical protein
MKKTIVFVLALALALPTMALAKTEFSMGGFIKLGAYWQSGQQSPYILPGSRNNVVGGTHGLVNFRANESRMNFTLHGPKVLGAVLTGFIEFDFDAGPQDNFSTSVSNPAGMRLRHAMFRLNWPDTELLMGQYWGLMASWWTDLAQDGQMMATATALERLPQIRVTQKVGPDVSLMGLIGLPNGGTLDNGNPYGRSNNGMASECPQVQASVKYAHDWWGKAGYFGHPRPFTAQVMAGFQRNVNRYQVAAGGNTANNLVTFWQDQYVTATNLNNLGAPYGTNNIIRQKYVNPWVVMGTLFIPVIPTHSANLAGTASLLAQWWIGQGVGAFGLLGDSSSIYQYQTTWQNNNYFDVKLLKRFGGVLQAQYYFTNQWYANVDYGLTRCYGVNTSSRNVNQDWLGADQFETFQEIHAVLWYQPVKALKLGLQYSYSSTKYFQATTTGGANSSDHGSESRISFAGFFFF